MALDIEGIPNTLFKKSISDNEVLTKEGKKDIPRPTPVISQEISEPNKYDSTETFHSLPLDEWEKVDPLEITHKSNTGKVLILFSATANPNDHVLRIRLEKNGQEVMGTKRDLMNPTVDWDNEEGGQYNVSIQIVDIAAKEDTWKITWKADYGDDDVFMYDRSLTIIDLF